MMKRILILGGVLLVIAVGVVAYSVLKPPKEASGPIEAIPIAAEQPASPEPDQIKNSPEPGAIVEATATTADDSESTNSQLGNDVPQAEATSEAISSSNTNPVIFEIVQADSEVRFVINEVLNGAPKTVVGATDQVAGEIAVDLDDPSKSQVGTIVVNARTLTTDNDFRNRAIKNRILSTDDYEFITFSPTEIVGLPGTAALGERFAFQMVGDLAVRDVTNRVTFEVAVTPISETQLEGIASTTILYGDFNLTIPSAPAVASVEEEVRLELEFVAIAK